MTDIGKFGIQGVHHMLSLKAPYTNRGETASKLINSLCLSRYISKSIQLTNRGLRIERCLDLGLCGFYINLVPTRF